MKFLKIIKTAAADFLDDDCMVSGAALAYYTIFSLPPLLVMIFFIAGWLGISQERINEVVSAQLGIPIPTAEAAEAEEGEQQASSAGVADRKSSNTNVMESLGPVSKLFGVLMLVFSATGVFAQLQRALNQAWEVEPDPEQGGIMNFMLKRGLSLGMIVVIAFLLLVSLVLTSLVDEIVGFISGESPSQIMVVFGAILNIVLSTAMATVLFTAVYKILPDADMPWKDVWMGGLITAVLFVVGKTVIGLYLENSNLGSSWGGAAGSMIAMLVWVYYTSLIVLFGAEMTQAWACEFGEGIKPSDKAVRVVVEKRQIANNENGGKRAGRKRAGKFAASKTTADDGHIPSQ
jgi:membrane protein